jgi:hypothetical protein
MEAAKLTQGGQTLQNAHCDDQWAFLQFPNPLAGLLDYEQPGTSFCAGRLPFVGLAHEFLQHLYPFLPLFSNSSQAISRPDTLPGQIRTWIQTLVACATRMYPRMTE